MNLDRFLMLLSEIDDVDRIEIASLESNLRQLVENIFKLQYWELEQGRNYRDWQSIISRSRGCIETLLQNHPSLRTYIKKIYPKLYQEAVKTLQSQFYIPENMPIELELILDKNYFG